jgi:hypothetical protein
LLRTVSPTSLTWRTSSMARLLKNVLTRLSALRSGLVAALDLRASVNKRLVMLVDRIRGALGLMLVRLRSALSQRSGALKSTLVQLTIGLRYTHRNEPDDDCWLPPRPNEALIWTYPGSCPRS